jgi:hypothetical protein
MQLPFAHWLLAVHVCPSASLHAPEPSHAFGATHALAGLVSVVPAGTIGRHNPLASPVAVVLHE